MFDLIAHLYRQRAFSRATFGPGPRAKGVVDHIRKELIEIERDPGDVFEWVDVILLALDGAWRAGCSPETIAAAISTKQGKNERRDWPDWRTADPDKAIEHKRGEGEPGCMATVREIARDVERAANAESETPSHCQFLACPSPYLCKSGCKRADEGAR